MFTHSSLGSIFHLNAPTRKWNFQLDLMPSTPTGSACFSLCFHEYLLSILLPHFRQTVFYTPTTMTVSQGDSITGRLSCSPNTRNNRDLDITISYKAGNDAENSIHYKMCVFLLSYRTSNHPWSGFSMRTGADRVSGLNYTHIAALWLFQRIHSRTLPKNTPNCVSHFNPTSTLDMMLLSISPTLYHYLLLTSRRY